MKEEFSVDDCLSPLDSFEQVLKMLEEFHLDERFEDIKGGGGMIRDKEWLIKELLDDEVDDYDNHYNGGYEDGLAYALKLAHQLDEPDKVVIPQFVATFIEDSRNKVGNIVTAIWEMYDHEYKDVYEWALEDGNDEVLMKAFANGYEIEKEKLYYVIIPTKCEDWMYYYLDDFGGIDKTNDLKNVTYHTEAFIRHISDNLWPFAKEVAE